MENWQEWGHLGLRWLHVFMAVLWIGQTWLFTFLDRCFEDATENPDGKVFMVHSGGFYQVEKKRVLLPLPKTLHWFKWEAGLTWITGALLLLIVYYWGGLMLDPESTMTETRAALQAAGVIVAAWIVYDRVASVAEGRFETPAAVALYFAILGVASYYSTFLTGRATFMHVGALMGTLMTANVWLRIIPGQRDMVRALAAGGEPDRAKGATAKLRSKHNTFMVIPVILTMIGSHFPTTTYGSENPIRTLAVLILVGFAAAAFIRKR
jgi:uncharacterized membrane protein